MRVRAPSCPPVTLSSRWGRGFLSQRKIIRNRMGVGWSFLESVDLKQCGLELRPVPVTLISRGEGSWRVARIDLSDKGTDTVDDRESLGWCREYSRIQAPRHMEWALGI